MIRLANDDRRAVMANSLDTSDLFEAVAICGVVYSKWRDSNHDIRATSPGTPRHLRAVSDGKYVEVAGYLPEPQTSFNGKRMPISAVAALAVGIDRPLTPMMRALWYGIIDIDGEEMPASISDLAECIVEYVAIERDETTT